MSVAELAIAMFVMASLLGTFYATYSRFLRDVAVTEELASIERASRPAINQLMIELRQSVAPDAAAAGQPVEELSGDHIVFYSDRARAEGPEKYHYERVNCVSSMCELELSVTFADPGTGPNWTYDTTPSYTRTIIERLPEAVTLFTGRASTPGGLLDVASCDRTIGGGTPCDFNAVLVEIHVAPNDRAPAPRNFEVIEEVKLRNAAF